MRPSVHGGVAWPEREAAGRNLLYPRADEARPERPSFPRLAQALEEQARLAEQPRQNAHLRRSLRFDRFKAEAGLPAEQHSHPGSDTWSAQATRKKWRLTFLTGFGMITVLTGIWAGTRLATTEEQRPTSPAALQAGDETLAAGGSTAAGEQSATSPPDLASVLDVAVSTEWHSGQAAPRSSPSGSAPEVAKLPKDGPEPVRNEPGATPSGDDRLRADDAYDRAYALQQEQRYEDALAAYRLAVAAEPESAHVLYGLATVLSRLGQIDEALTIYERAASAAPVNPFIFYDWGWMLERSGHSAAAREKYRRAASVGEGTSAAKNARARLGILP